MPDIMADMLPEKFYGDIFIFKRPRFPVSEDGGWGLFRISCTIGLTERLVGFPLAPSPFLLSSFFHCARNGACIQGNSEKRNDLHACRAIITPIEKAHTVRQQSVT